MMATVYQSDVGSMWIGILCIAVASWFFFIRKQRSELIPNIPVVPSNSWLFGFTEWGQTSVLFPFLEATGPIAQFFTYGLHVVVISDPGIAKKALRDITGKGFFHNPNPSVIELNTFNAQTGPEWQLRRNTFRRAFSTMCLRHHMSSISKITEAIANILEAKCDTSEVFRIDDIFQCLTIEIISKMAFEMDVTSEQAELLRAALQSIFEERWVLLLPMSWYLMRIPFGPFRKRKVAQDFWIDFKHQIWKHIRTLHSTNKLPKDSLAESILKFSELPGVTENEVIGEIGVFFLAGMDTTAHTMALAVYSLAANPAVQMRAQQEVDKHNADSAGTIIPPYVEAVLKESMRKYPTASSGSFRLVREENGVELSREITVKKDSWVLVNIYSIQNSVRIWGNDAHEFKPERFLCDSNNTSHENSSEIDPLDTSDVSLKSKEPGPHGGGNTTLASNSAFAGTGHNPDEISFIPFSYGIRNCIGMNLALLELRVGLSILLSRFTFELGDSSMQNDENMFETRFTSRPRNGLPIRVSRRL